jgi:hypothetical protein
VLREIDFTWKNRECLKRLMFEHLYPKDWRPHEGSNKATVAWLSVDYLKQVIE